MTTPTPGALEIKAGDLEPSVQTTLALKDSPVALTLTGVQAVWFLMRLKGPDGKPVGGEPRVKGLASIVDAAGCVVRYDWVTGDTSDPGAYLVEWEVWRNGRRRTFPTRSYNDLVIWQDLGDGTAS